MNTSEPTTEIVADLRIYLLVANKEKPTQLISTIARAADRLESQEHEIVGLTELNKAEYVLYKSEIDAYRIASESLKLTILRYMDMTQTLTARAEQAEKERDAAVADIEELLGQDDFIGICWACKSHDKCVGTRDVKITCVPKWRGLPQEGEVKK